MFNPRESVQGIAMNGCPTKKQNIKLGNKDIFVITLLQVIPTLKGNLKEGRAHVLTD